MATPSRRLYRHVTSRWTTLLLAGTLLLGGAACENILQVASPDILLPGDLTGPQGRAVLYAGAVGDFVLAYSGGSFNDSQVMATGLLTDEWILSGTFTTRVEIDRREIAPTNGETLELFSNLSAARRATENAAVALAEAPSGEEDARVGELWALAGYTYLLLGETFCNGIPVSRTDGGNIVHGQPLTNAEVFELAIERFDRSLQAHQGEADLLRLATVGKARALVNLDRVGEAAAVVGEIPTGWEFLIRHSGNTSRQWNSVHALNSHERRWSLADAEGTNGLPFRQLDDPRVPWTRTPPDAVGFDGLTPQFDLLKYPTPASPVALASGAEARYVEAEAALRSGDTAGFFSAIDVVRAQHGLPPAADPGTETGREDLLFRERALTLFATGTRLGDVRRLIRQYGRSAEDVLPTGPYFKLGLAYGDDVNFPVPDQERNNPNFTGCLDRSA